MPSLSPRRRQTALVLLLGLLVSAINLQPASPRELAIPEALGPGAELLPNGLYQVPLADGRVITTHGPDPKSVMLDGHGESLGPGDPERAPVCADDHYLHILYGRPAVISASRLETVVDEIRAHVRRMNAVLNEAAEESGDTSADYKVLCDEKGAIRVDEFVNPTAIPYFSFVVDGARQAGFDDPDADYVIFYDGNFPGICGVAELSEDDRLSPDNRNNDGGYGITYEDCWFSRTPMHENGHTQGAVQSGAPDHDGTNHCTDQLDIMCYPSTSRVCTTTQAFDCDYDTYFDAQPEPGEWLDSHWNIGSRFNNYIVFGDSAGSAGASGLADAIAGLELSQQRPKRGATITASMSLRDCDGHAGSDIELQRQRGDSFTTVATASLDENCEATVEVRATFERAVFRSFWPQQDDDHDASASRPRVVRTR